jgi:hypothetical protein
LFGEQCLIYFFLGARDMTASNNGPGRQANTRIIQTICHGKAIVVLRRVSPDATILAAFFAVIRNGMVKLF